MEGSLAAANSQIGEAHERACTAEAKLHAMQDKLAEVDSRGTGDGGVGTGSSGDRATTKSFSADGDRASLNGPGLSVADFDSAGITPRVTMALANSIASQQNAKPLGATPYAISYSRSEQRTNGTAQQ
jgi:hypothetical protein